jgi:hypothetical protein
LWRVSASESLADDMKVEGFATGVLSIAAIILDVSAEAAGLVQ